MSVARLPALLPLLLLAGLSGVLPAAPPEVPSGPFDLASAIRLGLQNNPDLQALRRRHEIAAAEVVIARTYPFNPALESRVRRSSGPPGQIANDIGQEHRLFMDVELRGQGKLRRQAATQALARTDWEIAFQEQQTAAKIVRAFAALAYREQKLKLAEETLAFNEQAEERVAKLAAQGALHGADTLLSRAETDDTRLLAATARLNVETARADLERLLGLLGRPAEVRGALAPFPSSAEESSLVTMALARRGDLQAKRAGMAEERARTGLAKADRYGNVTMGLNWERDSSDVTSFGPHVDIPLPFLNQHTGEIRQHEAQETLVRREADALEIAIRQEVHASLRHGEAARSALRTYEQEVLPRLTSTVEGIEKLFSLADPTTDSLRVLDVRRKLLRARDGLLDARWESEQAMAELCDAVGDPELAVDARLQR